MDFNPCLKHKLVRKSVREFAEAEIAPLVYDLDREARFPWEIIEKMRPLNFFGLQIPRAYGGAGIDTISYAVAIEELSRVSAALGLCVTVHNSVGAYPIVRFGTDAQKKRFLPALASGERIVGQHRMTGKEASPLTSQITDLWLARDRENPSPVTVPIRQKMADLIDEADLICYPVGSFYSSIIANLLPRGVGGAVAGSRCPKVFVPNTGAGDPEAVGMEIMDQIEGLVSFLVRDDPAAISARDVLNFVLVDQARGDYRGKLDRERLTQMGIDVIDTALVSENSHPLIDAKLLVPVLLSLA